MTLRLLAVIACVLAIILFVVEALNSTANPDLVDWGLAAFAAGVAFLCLEGVSIGPRQ